MQSLVNQIESVLTNITSISDYIISISFSDDLSNTTQQTNTILANNNTLTDQYTKLTNEQQTIQTLHESSSDISNVFTALYNNFTELMTQLAQIENNITASSWLADNLANNTHAVNNQIAQSDSLIEYIEQLLPEAHDQFMIAINNIEMLQSLFGSIVSSGSGESGIGMLSILPDLINELEGTVTQLDKNLKNSLWSFNTSLENGQNVYQTSLEVQKYVMLMIIHLFIFVSLLLQYSS